MVRIKNFFKSAGRYLKSILPAFLFFTTLLFSFSVPVFATSGGLVTVKPGSPSLNTSVARWIIEYSMELGDNINDDFMVLQKGALYWFFDVLVNDTYGASTSTFTVMGQSYSVTPHSVRAVSDGKNLDKFDDDYFHTYFDCIRRYCLSNLSEQTDPSCTTFVSNYFYNLMERKPNYLSRFPCSFPDIFFYASDPGSNYISDSMGMLPSNESNVKKYFDYLYADYLKSNGLSGVSVGYDNISDIDNYTKLPIISGDTFNEIIPTLNNQYYPKNATGKMSYRTDERFHNCYDSWSSPLEYCMLDFYAGDFGFSATGGKKEMYFVFFEKLGESSFYGQYQFHCTITAEDVPYEDRDEVQYTNYTLNFECWDNIDGSQSNPTSLASITKTSPYFVLALNSSRPELYNFSSYSNYISGNASSWNTLLTDYNLIHSLWKSDLSTSIRFSYSDQQHFKGSLSSHNSSCSYNGSCDFGYLASSAPISTLYNIDTTRIPENYYITVSGDTIYDYSITNPETGQKDTIQNFITNNYTFNNGDTNIDTGDHNTSIGGSGSGNGGGGGGGDVNVNVTVNNNIGGGGDGGSYDMPDTSFFDDYLDDALEESTGIRKFISDFFNSLPGQITKLICTGLVLAILCRLIGR